MIKIEEKIDLAMYVINLKIAKAIKENEEKVSNKPSIKTKLSC